MSPECIRSLRPGSLFSWIGQLCGNSEWFDLDARLASAIMNGRGGATALKTPIPTNDHTNSDRKRLALEALVGLLVAGLFLFLGGTMLIQDKYNFVGWICGDCESVHDFDNSHYLDDGNIDLRSVSNIAVTEPCHESIVEDIASELALQRKLYGERNCGGCDNPDCGKRNVVVLVRDSRESESIRDEQARAILELRKKRKPPVARRVR